MLPVRRAFISRSIDGEQAAAFWTMTAMGT